MKCYEDSTRLCSLLEFHFTKKRVAIGIRHTLHRGLLGYFLPLGFSRKGRKEELVGQYMEIEPGDRFVTELAFNDGVGWRVIARRKTDGIKVWFYQFTGNEVGKKFLEIKFI